MAEGSDQPGGGGAGNGGAPAGDVRRGPDPTKVDSWTQGDWQSWYDTQPDGVKRMLDNQARAATNFEAIRGRFGDDFDVIDQAMKDEERLKELRRLKDPKFYDFTIKRGGKIFDETFRSSDGGGGGGAPTQPTAVEKKLDDLSARLDAEQSEKARANYIESRNQEFLALAREHGELFMQHDPATDPDANEKNALAQKRAERLINLAEHRSKAQFGERYFATGNRVALKDVLDDVLIFTDRQARHEPPPAAPRLTRSGVSTPARQEEPSADPDVERERMLKNVRAAGGFARSARAGRG